MKRLFFIIKSRFDNLTKKRLENSNKYKATNIFLTLAFPIFLTAMIEIIQMKSVKAFVLFMFSRPTVLLFNVILVSILYAIVIFFTKKIYLATTGVGLALTTLAIVELFKFNTSGNHLILTDMKMAVNINKLKSFAYIKITPQLVVLCLIILAYLVAVYWFNPVIKTNLKKRLASASVCIASIVTLLFAPSVAMPVYSFFNIDTTYTDNVFRINEKFENNNFLAFLAQTTTEYLSRKVKEPEQYNQESITTMLSNVSTDNNAAGTNYKRPNVIMIMSEAFADFRKFDELDIDPSIYAAYDRIKEKSFSGTAVVPAFGAYTVRTEFELNFGLPCKSLNDPNMPQRLLLDRPQQTIPSYFKSLGYNTNYIHTFDKTFYGRNKVFANYGFDNMYFSDNLTVPVENYEAYISDKVIFNQVEQMLKNTDEPVFIHTTTMQNHQPYNPTPEYTTQLDYYLAGVKDMLGNLEKMLEDLEKSGEPTVVFMVGDHYPAFKGEDSIYNTLGITGENAGHMYEQPYFIWSNYDIDTSKGPTEKVSSFYLPYIIMDMIDAPKSTFVQAMLDKMKTVPVYTTNYDINIPNDKELDMYTYDIVLGHQYLGEVRNAGSTTTGN